MKRLLLVASMSLCLAWTTAAGEPLKPVATKEKKPAKKEAKAAEESKAKPAKKPAKPPVETLGAIERLDPALNKLIPTNAVIEKLAEGFKWSEGPVWMGSYLLFSDVPRNVILKWQEGKPIEEFLAPSGYSGKADPSREPGSNGLTRDRSGHLVICQHGDRRIARLEGEDKVVPVVEYYEFRRFNSPNDAVYRNNGDLFFTDPPYGLKGGAKDPKRELPFFGVYRLPREGKLSLVTDDLSRPNGIAFGPDEKVLYVANSDPERPVIMAYNVQRDGSIGKGRVFFDASDLLKSGRKGMPDGLKVDVKGNLFATGPGGVLVLSPAAKLLGIINTGEPTANCAWGDNGGTLYITANKYLCRVKTSTKGRMP